MSTHELHICVIRKLPENPQGRAPACLDCAKLATAMCGGCNSVNGPIFSGGMSLCPNNNPASSFARPSAVYPDTTGLGVALFTGAGTFTPEDYEVWAVT